MVSLFSNVYFFKKVGIMTLFLAANAIRETRHTRQSKPFTVIRIVDRALKVGALIASMSIIAACSGVPLIVGI